MKLDIEVVTVVGDSDVGDVAFDAFSRVEEAA